MGSGFEGFDFSHEGVKRVVGLLTGFVSVIASPPYCFLYLNQRIHDIKKEKENAPYFPLTFLVGSPSRDSNLNIMRNHSESLFRL